MQVDSDLISKDTAAINSPISVFSDPTVFYTYSLIATQTAESIEAILSKFPEDLDTFIKKTLTQLEDAKLIVYENGKFKSTKNNVYSKVTKEDQAKLYPELFSGSVKAVVNNLNNGSYVKNGEDFSFYFVSDHPQVRAELKALSAHIDNEVKRIIDKSQNLDSSGVRIFGFVNSLPKAEDFL